MKKIAILASGFGSNAENLHNFFAAGSRVKVELVIYDRKDAPVAERMRALGVDTLYLPAETWTERPDEIVDLLRGRGIDLVVLAGFLRMVPRAITEAFAGRIINIHPSLLPAYGGRGMYGRRIHEAVIAAGETETGVTVHYVTDDLDSGQILLQERLEVKSGESAEELEKRVHELEYSMLPRAVMTALAAMTPPPAPDVPPGQQWAERLGVSYDPSKLPPEYPGSTAQPDPAPQPAGVPPYGAPPQPGSPYGPQMQWAAGSPRPTNVPEGEKMPPSYLAWAIVMTVLCCLPAGVVAIIFASQVSSKFYSGDLEGARRSSRNAEIWIIVSFVLGVMFNTLYVPLSVLF